MKASFFINYSEPFCRLFFHAVNASLFDLLFREFFFLNEGGCFSLAQAVLTGLLGSWNESTKPTKWD